MEEFHNQENAFSVLAVLYLLYFILCIETKYGVNFTCAFSARVYMLREIRLFNGS